MAQGISPNNLNKISQVYLSQISEHHKKDADGNTIPHEDENIGEEKVDMKKYKEDMSHSFEVEPVTWEANIERLFYRIDPNDNKIGKVSMLWENIIIQFDVDTMTEEHLERFAKTLE